MADDTKINKEPEKNAKKTGGQIGKMAGSAIGGPVGGMVGKTIGKSKIGRNLVGNAFNMPGLIKGPNGSLTNRNANMPFQNQYHNHSMGLSNHNVSKENDAQDPDNQEMDDIDSSEQNDASSTFNQNSINNSNSGFGESRSGLFSNPGLNSRFKGNANGKPNDDINSSSNFNHTLKKAKHVVGIASTAFSIILPILVVFIVITVVVGQIAIVRDSIDALADKFTTGVEKLINFSHGNGWMTNENAFFNKLNESYKKYRTFGELDIPLIAATVHYGITTDLNQFEEESGNTTDDSDDELFHLGKALSKDETVRFYQLATDRLGEVNTVQVGKKGLLGHLVKTEISLDWYDFNGAVKAWGEFLQLFQSTVEDTTNDLNLTPTGNLIALLEDCNTNIQMYKDGLAGIKFDAANILYDSMELRHDLEMALQKNGIDSNTINSNTEEISKDSTDNDGNAIKLFLGPKITRKMDDGYDEYNQMKKDLLSIKAKLRTQEINFTDDEDALNKAKNSGDSELQELYNDYSDNQFDYEYSYAHYLKNVYIPFTYFYDQTSSSEKIAKLDTKIDSIIDEIYDQRDFFNYLIDEEDDNGKCGTGNCSYNVYGKQISNLKVRLLQCSDENFGKPIPGEELVDFNKYITGVVYAEAEGLGVEEGLNKDQQAEMAKTLAIAARNFALTRPRELGNTVTLTEEDGQWILSIRNCVEDQVYCDPDNGCSANHPASATMATTMYSGADTHPYKYKGKLADDSVLRTAVLEVAGETLLNEKDEMMTTGYSGNFYWDWINMIKKGYDYTDILMSYYSNYHSHTAKEISKSSCSKACHAANGEYTQWKQCGQPWGSMLIGRDTICNIGCAATSVAILIAKSGVELTIPELNPGTFVQKMKEGGGFAQDSIYWARADIVAPRFKFVKFYQLNSSMTKQEKANIIRNLLNEGCYLTLEVKGYGGGEHYVAVDYVDGDDVYMMDPASNSVIAWDQYSHNWSTGGSCYKVS